MSEPILVKPGKKLKLADIDANSTKGLNKTEAAAVLAKEAKRIGMLQTKLYAEDRRALLVVLQGMDTAGKDGTVRTVFDAVNPVGLEVASFGRPSDEETDHDFLWRIHKSLPRYGNIGVFNRSHYEDVLVVRVRGLAPEKVWRKRYDQINQWESLVSDLGYKVLKFYLHIDKDEQKQRLEERLADKAKRYKFRLGDLDDRALWKDYMSAYEDALERCSTTAAPWYIVPANKKWYRSAVIARKVAETLAEMEMKLPKVDFDPKKVRVPD